MYVKPRSILNNIHLLFIQNNVFYSQSKGDRYYFHETLKVKAETIRKLKNWNESYPQNNLDYDIIFIYHLAVAIFKDVEIKGFLKKNTLKCFDVERLRFVRSKFISILFAEILLTQWTAWFVIAIYEERVGDDKVRKKAFREHLVKALSDKTKKNTSKKLAN